MVGHSKQTASALKNSLFTATQTSGSFVPFAICQESTRGFSGVTVLRMPERHHLALIGVLKYTSVSESITSSWHTTGAQKTSMINYPEVTMHLNSNTLRKKIAPARTYKLTIKVDSGPSSFVLNIVTNVRLVCLFHAETRITLLLFCFVQAPRGVLLYISNIGICRTLGYGFRAVLVWNRVCFSLFSLE